MEMKKDSFTARCFVLAPYFLDISPLSPGTALPWAGPSQPEADTEILAETLPWAKVTSSGPRPSQ